MIKRPFFSLGKPKLRYQVISDQEAVVEDVSLPGRVSLLVKGCDIGAIKFGIGTSVLTGQKLIYSGGYVLSPVTGVIREISDYRGYLNELYALISIDVTGEDRWDGQLTAAISEPTFDTALGYLGSIPGKSDFASFLALDPPVNTVVIDCMDLDLLVTTRQHILALGSDKLAEGIGYLKQVCRIGRVVVAASSSQLSLVSGLGVEVREVSDIYPGGISGIVAKDVLGSDYASGKSFEQMGIGFISAEAVIWLADVFGKQDIGFDKVVTVIGKDGIPVLVKARVGTPVKDIFDMLGISVSNGDRVILGGPMTGKAISSELMPIMWDTDAVMVQDGSDIVLSSDEQCVNCGECVRVCPVDVPVNMLVRVLSNGLYEDAAQMYDLHCCIECGLCNYVCVARIPIFHYIMLGKHEFARLEDAEGSNG